MCEKLICHTDSHTELQMICGIHHMHFNEDRERANLCRTCLHALWLDNILYYYFIKTEYCPADILHFPVLG
jgi:hypothetical protein